MNDIKSDNPIVLQINHVTNGRLSRMLKEVVEWKPENKRESEDKTLVLDTLVYLILGDTDITQKESTK